MGGREIKRNIPIASYVLKKTVNIIPRIIKAIPPAFSFFQEKINKRPRRIAGMLCIKNPPIFSEKDPSISKTSREKRTTIQIRIIMIILGDQKRILFLFICF
jgi:hypothetical protein